MSPGSPKTTEADHAAFEHYLTAFYDAVVEVDGVRLDALLDLPAFGDNFDSRLIKRRLDEH